MVVINLIEKTTNLLYLLQKILNPHKNFIMNLNSYCEHVLPTSLEHLISFDLDSSIKMCEHDAIHYLTQQGFTQNEEILVAHLEVKHDVGFIDNNSFYHLIKSKKKKLIT